MAKEKSPYYQCLYYASNALARNMSRLAEEEFAVTGLAPSYAFLVMTVNNRPGITAGELAQIMMLKPSTVTRLVEKMEEQVLLKRMKEKRSTLIFPTKKSVELQESIKQAWMSLYERYVKLLGGESSAELTNLVYSAAVNLEVK
jgi:DNA-binding MarR family transcriptional regulator